MNIQPNTRVFVFLLAVLALYKPIEGSNILLATTTSICSHVIATLEIAKTLVARGHQVWILTDHWTHGLLVKKVGLPENVTFVLYKYRMMSHLGNKLVKVYIADSLHNAEASTVLRRQIEDIESRFNFPKLDLGNSLGHLCDDMLGDADAMKELKSVRFDMIVGELIWLCHVYLGEVLKVPVINFGLTTSVPSQHDRFAYNPVNSAYVPERMSSLTDTMSFRERCKNTFLYWLTSFFYYKFMLGPMDEVLMKRNIRPDANFGQLLSEAEMWIFNSDVIVDHPRPLSPHVKFVGAVLTQPARPLNEEWEDFVRSSGEHGVVLFSLGTLISDELTDKQTENIAKSLAMLPQKVAWKHSGRLPKTLGNNTKIVEWLPQNDLLGHPMMRAFISHGGVNGVHQCIYHAVPIVGIPIFGDQRDNLVRVGAKGMAVILDIHSLTDRSIYEATVEVIYNNTYKKAVEHYSAIARDRIMPMSPIEEVAYWVEYAIKHGTGHLKPRAMQLSLIQYYLLDVIAVLAVIATAVIWFLLKVCCRFRCRKN